MVGLVKKINAQGQKAYQRNDREDRSLVYRDWVRTVDTGGFLLDVDHIKYRWIDGKPKPVAITELTRCDSESVAYPYLNAITDRFFRRDKQGEIINTLASLLHVPAYLVLFQKDMLWLWVFSFQKKEWREFTPERWSLFLKKL